MNPMLLMLTLSAAAPSHPVSIAAVGGYSVDGASDVGQTGNMFGVGFGARAGHTFPFGLYAGVSGTYDLGYSETIAKSATAESRVSPVGIEGGYELHLDALTLRPYLGAGVAFYASKEDGPPPAFFQGNGTKPALWPGVVATYGFGDRLFAGLDLRYTVVFAGAESYDVAPAGGAPEAFGAFGVVGVELG